MAVRQHHGNEAIGFEIEPVGFAQVVRVLKYAASEKQVLYELAAGGLQVIGKMFLEHFKQALVFLGGFDLFCARRMTAIRFSESMGFKRYSENVVLNGGARVFKIPSSR